MGGNWIVGLGIFGLVIFQIICFWLAYLPSKKKRKIEKEKEKEKEERELAEREKMKPIPKTSEYLREYYANKEKKRGNK